MSKICIIGAGKMGMALAHSCVESLLFKQAEILLIERSLTQLEQLKSSQWNVEQLIEQGVSNFNIIIVAVKPQDWQGVAEKLRNYLRPTQLVISVMAGVHVESIRSALGHSCIIRTMPNLALTVRNGMTVCFAPPSIPSEALIHCRKIFESAGTFIIVDREELVDAATAISGSGPGYLSLLLDRYINTAISLGFTPQQAQLLVIQTILGTVDLIETQTPSELFKSVCSKGGTTEAAAIVFNQGKLLETFSQGIQTAYQRARQISQSK